MVEGIRSRPLATAGLRVASSSEVHSTLAYDTLIEALRGMFRNGCETSPPLEQMIGHDASERLLVAPAWQNGKYLGVKIETFFESDDDPNLTGQGLYALLNGATGQACAAIDAAALTYRRTAACSALAASYLARPDCERLLVVGTGAMAPHLVEAHIQVRPIRNILIWGRDAAKAERLAHRLDRRQLRVAATTDLAAAVRGAHVITCATASTEPLIKGEWLPKGAHLDLVGGVNPDMREADDDCISRARIFVDSLDEALARAGDIIQPIESGRLRAEDIGGEMRDLARGSSPSRRYYDQITLFKSVGTPLADLAAATHLFDLLRS